MGVVAFLVAFDHSIAAAKISDDIADRCMELFNDGVRLGIGGALLGISIELPAIAGAVRVTNENAASAKMARSFDTMGTPRTGIRRCSTLVKLPKPVHTGHSADGPPRSTTMPNGDPQTRGQNRVTEHTTAGSVIALTPARLAGPQDEWSSALARKP